MKILVLSDSHGNMENMVRAVELEKPGMIFHLGDCWRDGERLAARFPEIPVEQVPGNCDFRSREVPERLLVLEDHRLLLCHGHTYGVKQSLMSAGQAAREKDLDAFLFGHTHQPLLDRRGKTLFVNPGSIGSFTRPTYAVLIAASGSLDAAMATLN